MFITDLESGRGIGVYVKKTLSAVEVVYNEQYKESIWCEISLNIKDKLVIGCVYRSPSNPLEDIHKLTATLNNVIVQGYTHVLILGDFNLKEIDWKTQTTDKNENHPSTIFLETIRDLFLHQHVKEPTRMRGEDIPTTLDLILTNEENMVEQLHYLPG